MPAMQNIANNSPQIDEHQRHFLDENISFGELKTALDGVVNHQAPDFDGLPAEFYKTFWDMLVLLRFQFFFYTASMRAYYPLGVNMQLFALSSRRGICN